MTHPLSSAELCLYYWEDAPETYWRRIEALLPPGVLKTEKCCKEILSLWIEYFPDQIERVLHGHGMPNIEGSEIIAERCIQMALKNGDYYPIAV